MPGQVEEFPSYAPRRYLAVVALLGVIPLGTGPAQAQDLFGFFRQLFDPPRQAPTYYPERYRAFPDYERPAVRHRPKVIRIDPPPVKMPLKPKAPGEVTNPVPELLADSTLRRGDVVMFPDGPRVFVGQPGDRHALADFEPVSRAARTLPSSARKAVASLAPGWNGAWSANMTSKLAANAREPQSTGSVKQVRP